MEVKKERSYSNLILLVFFDINSNFYKS
jgi:hypothetical protein